MIKRLAILTGGGHISVLNSGIAAIIDRAKSYGWEILGAVEGWRGMQEDLFVILDLDKDQTTELSKGGGTVIQSSRTKPKLDQVAQVIRKRHIDAVIAMGGDDTLGAAANLHESTGVPIVGWPKTMDNDLSKTHFCFGYPTAIRNAASCIRESFDGAYSHKRFAIVTMFGRDTDWVVIGGGGYGYADLIIPAEQEFSIDEVYSKIEEIYVRNNGFAVIAVAEGAKLAGLESHVREEDIDEFGHYKLDPHLLVTSLGSVFRQMSKTRSTREIRATLISLTYQLRNGPPVEIDRRLALDAGRYCVDMLAERRWGEMATITLEDDQLQVNSSVPLTHGATTRSVKGTGYFDYKHLRVTEQFYKYAKPFLGERNPKPGYSFSMKKLA